MPPKSVLFFGATGLIGGAFLSHLYAKYGSATTEHYQISIASRNLEKANKIKDILPGIQVVSLSFEDTQSIEKAVEKYEIVMQVADADAFEATLAILRGMKTRKDKTGVTPVFYHTSGAAFLFEEEAQGLPPKTQTPLSDTESAKINAIPLTKLHRNVDDAIVQADEAGYVRSYIIVPVGVFGMPTGIVHEHGLANLTSVPVPMLIYASADRKAVGQIGPGENIFSIVHVDDVANFLLVILEHDDDSLSHGKDGFYIIENGFVKQKDATTAVAKTLHEIGLSDRDVPNEYAPGELERYGMHIWGLNLSVRGDKARALGWKPQHGEEEFVVDVARETKRLAPLPLESYGKIAGYLGAK